MVSGSEKAFLVLGHWPQLKILWSIPNPSVPLQVGEGQLKLQILGRNAEEEIFKNITRVA